MTRRLNIVYIGGLVSLVFIMLQLIFGWLYGHIFEYITHRHILHNRKKFKKIFRNHFKRHHNISRKNNMYDENYTKLISSKFEITALFVIAIIHLPLLFFVPYFYSMIVWSVCAYYVFHRISHVRTEFGKKMLPWHHEHHMGINQNTNWGVRLPIIDKIMRTSNY